MGVTPAPNRLCIQLTSDWPSIVELNFLSHAVAKGSVRRRESSLVIETAKHCGKLGGLDATQVSEW